MKKYAIYEYDRNKLGFEKYKFLYEAETNEPGYAAGEIFSERFKLKAKTKFYEMRIKINEVSFNSFTVAFNGIDKEIILAERL